MKALIAEPLSVEGFLPFGDVVSAGLSQGKDANQGSAVRFDWTSALESSRPHAKANLVALRCQPKQIPFEVKLLERHPCSTQAFLPMLCSTYLVVVSLALEDGSPNLASLRAFVCSPGQGINYRRNVWHHPIVALNAPADFAMLVWEDGTADDLVEHWLPSPITVLSGS